MATERKGKGTPTANCYLPNTQSLWRYFGLFSLSPMNGCRQGISDGFDKGSLPLRMPPSFKLTLPPRAISERHKTERHQRGPPQCIHGVQQNFL